MTTDTIAPSTPANLTASAVSCSQINLAWTAASDTGGSGLKGYVVYRKKATDTSFTFVKQVLVPAVSTSDTALLASTAYSYDVRAIDNTGNMSPTSNVASATTSACSQPPVANAGPDMTDPVGTAVPFNGSGSSGSIVTYAWSFGDGGSGTGAVLNHAYAAAGTYTARLTVTDNLGLQSSDTATVNITATAASGAYQWARRYGGSSNDRFTATAIDKRANCDGANGTNCIVVAGGFIGTVDFGTGALTSLGAEDVVVAKYTASGAPLWARRVGGTGGERATAVAVDPSGNVVVLAYTGSASVDFGGGALTGGGGVDIVVAKYAGTSGAHLWSKRIGGTGTDFGWGLAVDGTGSVLLAGSYGPPVDFGGGPLRNAYGIVTDLFVAKYDTNGAYVWAKNFYNTSEAMAKAVAVDASNNVVVTGYFKGTMDMTQPGSGTVVTTSKLSNPSAWGNVFVAKLTAGGTYLWSRNFGNVDFDDVGNAIAVDPSGNVVVTGTCEGTGDFGGTALACDTAGDVFVAKYAGANGAHVWSRRVGGPYADAGRGIAVDPATGDVVVTGSFDTTANFGGATFTSAGGLDIVVAKYAAATGAHVWSKRLGGVLSDEGNAIATATTGAITVTGYFGDAVDFGGGVLTSAGGVDAFTLNLAP